MTLNDDIIRTLIKLENMPKVNIPRGEKIEDTITGVFMDTCSFKRISIKEFEKTGNEILINSLGEVSTKFSVDDPLLITQPRGMQRPPDNCMLYKNRGIPSETKTSKQQKITWNSSLPLKYGLYILNGTTLGKSDINTTYSMGCDLSAHVVKY